jgi:two-component system chemotaxis response regulator CheY
MATLHLADPSLERAGNVLANRKTTGSSHRLKVLVTENEFTSRLILQDLLSKYGDCHVAVNGSEAVEAFRAALVANNGYDLICMDIRMPVMDGTDAVRLIRSIEEENGIYSSEGVKIFMTISIRDVGTVTKSFKALCDTYLFKPIDGTDLDEHFHIEWICKVACSGRSRSDIGDAADHQQTRRGTGVSAGCAGILTALATN